MDVGPAVNEATGDCKTFIVDVAVSEHTAECAVNVTV
jgi:hypothetical protein